MQNDNTPTKINSPQNTISVESQTEQTENMQNDNTSISDSEICQTAERLERLANSLNIPKLDHYRSLFKPEKKNQIISQQKDLASSEEKEQGSKQQDSEDKKKKNCHFCKSKKHEDKICPDILEKSTKRQKRKSDGGSDIPKKKRKLSKIR